MPDFSTQTDIFDPHAFAWPVHVIGVGGIGSHLILSMAKMGVSTIHLWDFDSVEDRNTTSQLYRPSDIGTLKVEAAKQILESFGIEAEIITHAEAVDATAQLDGVVISGVDSMKARKAIWEAVKTNFYQIPLYMDGRIGGVQLQLHTLAPSDFDAAGQYEQHHLFDDNKAEPLPCAGRTTIFTPMVLDGLILANLALFAKGEPARPYTHMHLGTMQYI